MSLTWSSSEPEPKSQQVAARGHNKVNVHTALVMVKTCCTFITQQMVKVASDCTGISQRAWRSQLDLNFLNFLGVYF